MSVKAPERAHRQKLPALPAGKKPWPMPAFPVLQTDPHEPGIGGLDPQVFATPVSPLARSYLVLALDYFHFPKNINPSQFVFGGGTIPEMVTFGGLLARNYVYNQQSAGGFTFQSSALGGRAAGGGGAVVDVVVFTAHRVIGVRVQSIFHAPQGNFTGGAKVEQDINQRVRLVSKGAVGAIFDINDYTRGFALEHGGDGAVRREFDLLFLA